MKVTMWVMVVIGLIEMVANLFFLTSVSSGKGLEYAKKFHGDFPASASRRAWINKIVVSIVLGAIALAAAFSIYKDYDTGLVFASLFAGGMLLLGIIQAALYWKKHIPARISVVIGLALVALVVFRV